MEEVQTTSQSKNFNLFKLKTKFPYQKFFSTTEKPTQTKPNAMNVVLMVILVTSVL